MLDIYHKPTHSFSYLHYKSCHPRHRRDNIALSLGQRIVRLVSEDRQLRLQQLKSELIKRGHPAKIIDDTFSKLLPPVRDKSSTALESIPFIYTYNPGTRFNKNKITKCLEIVKSNTLVQTFWNKRPFVSTRQSDNIQKNLTRSKFNMSLVKHIPEKIVSLFNCSDNRCMLHNNGYINSCKEFTFKVKHGFFTWKYNRSFNCNSINVIYMLICVKCGDNYIGETQNLRGRTNNTKSKVRYSENNSLEYTKHFSHCSNLIEPYFYVYPFYFEDDVLHRKFKELRFIKRFKPSLNNKL